MARAVARLPEHLPGARRWRFGSPMRCTCSISALRSSSYMNTHCTGASGRAQLLDHVHVPDIDGEPGSVGRSPRR